MEGKLQKPVFVKVSSLENSRDGYNVYVKIVSAETSKNENQTFEMVRAVVADQTGCANAFFKGDNAKLIKKDGVIAIRNGRIRLIKGHISLEVDLFGRITQQKVEIKNPNTTNNISEKQIARRPRFNKGEGRPRRQGDNKEGGSRRQNNRENGQRRPKRQDNQRNFTRRDDGDRKPRREDNDGQRKPRRDYEDRKPNSRFEGDRKPRRDDNEGGERQRTQWTKVGAIQPGEEGLNLLVKVLSVEPVKNKARVVVGDETGKVKAFLYYDEETLKEGNTVVIFKAQASVNKEHIELITPKGGKVELSRNRKITEVDETVDISAKAWVESA